MTFFTRCRGQGLLRLLLSDHDILHAEATPDDVGERSYAVYLEGVSTIAHHVQQVQDVEQLAYAIGPERGVHFFASGTRTYELARSGVWRSAVARGSMAFLGQYVTVTATGEKAICEGAVFTPRTGLWDLSFRALPTASELSQHPSLSATHRPPGVLRFSLPTFPSWPPQYICGHHSLIY